MPRSPTGRRSVSRSPIRRPKDHPSNNRAGSNAGRQHRSRDRQPAGFRTQHQQAKGTARFLEPQALSRMRRWGLDEHNRPLGGWGRAAPASQDAINEAWGVAGTAASSSARWADADSNGAPTSSSGSSNHNLDPWDELPRTGGRVASAPRAALVAVSPAERAKRAAEAKQLTDLRWGDGPGSHPGAQPGAGAFPGPMSLGREPA